MVEPAKLPSLYELLAGCVVTAHNTDRWEHGTLGKGFGDEVAAELLEIPRSFVEAVTMTGSSRYAQGHSSKWKESQAHTFKSYQQQR